MSTWIIITFFGAIGLAWAWFIYSRTDEQMASMTRTDQTMVKSSNTDICPLVPGIGYRPGVVDVETYIHGL